MLIACSIFRQKIAMLTVMFNINSSSTSRILKTPEFLVSQFMLVVSEQFTSKLEQRSKLQRTYLADDNENNRELQIIVDFIVII